jgi:tRNA (mo5U34)-methyltransferase
MELDPGGRGIVARHEKTIAELEPWFHNLHLPDGTQTAPEHPLGDFPRYKWRELAPHLPEDLRGWSVLDIGCNAGFYSFELAARGADVLGVDPDPHFLAQAQWACRQFDMTERVRFERMQVYDLARLEETFDLVLFMGVFYHLRYPMLGLDIVSQRVRRLLVFQSVQMPGKLASSCEHWNPGLDEREAFLADDWPKLAFVEHHFSSDPTNWWLPNPEAMDAMLRSCGLRVVGHPYEECVLAEPDPDRPSSSRTWNAAEYLAATAQPWSDAWTGRLIKP